MKRLLTLILAVCLSLCTAVTVSAVDSAQDTASVIKEVELLKALNIFDADIDSQKKVTRAEFAGYMASVLNVEEYNKYDKIYFIDVPATYWKSNSINGLAELGVITGDGVTGFRPDDYITVSETASMLLKAMGYGDIAENSGGYPNGYMKLFADLKLGRGMDASNGEMTNANIAKIFYNAFDTPIMKPSSGKGNIILYENDESATFLYEYKGIRSAKGRVMGINGLSLNDSPSPTEGYVRIDNETYECEDGYVRPFLGKSVEFWYKDDVDEGGKKALFMYESMKTDIVTVSADDIIDFDSDSYTMHYYSNRNSKRTARINADAEFIENGSKSVSSVSQSIDSLKFGQITLYDTDGKSGYDAVVCHRYEICVVKSYDSNDNIIYGDYIDGKRIQLDDYDTIKVFFESGESAKLSDIREHDVLTVIRSAGYLEMYICRQTATGIIETIGTDSIIVDGAEYPLNEYIKDKNKLIFNIGSSVIVRLNHTGIVVDCEAEGEGKMSYAYIRNSYRDEENKLFFKLYLFSNEFANLELADKVKVDGKSYEGDNINKAVFGGAGIAQPMLVRYAVNEDGKICEIDTPNKTIAESDETLRCNQDFANLQYAGSGRVGRKVVLSRDGTKVLAVPTDEKIDGADLKDYQLGTPRTMLLGEVSYEIATYTVGNNKGAEDIAVIKRDLEYKVDFLSKLMLVSKVYEGLDNEGNVSLVIEGYYGGPVTYYMDPALYAGTISKGDILHYEIDTANHIRSVEMLYKYTKENDGNPTDQWGGPMMNNFNDPFRLSWGYITSVKDNIIKWGYTSPNEVDEAYYWTQKVLFFDGNKVWSGSLSEITTAEMNPISPDRIIVKSKNGQISYVFVYKNPV